MGNQYNQKIGNKLQITTNYTSAQQ